MTRALALCLALAACGADGAPPKFGPANDEMLDCRSPTCPTAEALIYAERLFAACYDGDAGPPPTTIWRPTVDDAGNIVDSWGRTVQGSYNRGWLEVGRWAPWTHERIHVAHAWEGISAEATHPCETCEWPRGLDRFCDHYVSSLLHRRFEGE